jgi:hypothetical protein
MQHAWEKLKLNTTFYLELLKGRHHSDDQGVDGRKIIVCLKEIGCENMSWIYAPQERVQSRNAVYTVMNFGFHKSKEFLDKMCNY